MPGHPRSDPTRATSQETGPVTQGKSRKAQKRTAFVARAAASARTCETPPHRFLQACRRCTGHPPGRQHATSAQAATYIPTARSRHVIVDSKQSGNGSRYTWQSPTQGSTGVTNLVRPACRREIRQRCYQLHPCGRDQGRYNRVDFKRPTTQGCRRPRESSAY
jgi:hypothetical protein